jgi:hypothetical protein
MPPPTINYIDQRHGACPVCMEDFGGEESGQLVCAHIVCESCLISMTRSTPAHRLRCPVCRAGIAWNQIRGAEDMIPETQEVVPELGMTWQQFDNMRATPRRLLTRDQRRTLDRAMNRLAATTR